MFALYLYLLSAQHCQLSHVSEWLQQVLVQLRGGLQQSTIGLILLLIQLQQLHHAVHALVFLQQLCQKEAYVITNTLITGDGQQTGTSNIKLEGKCEPLINKTRYY